MILTETALKGAYIIEIEKIEDERGFFARSWDKSLFEQKGLNTNLVQCNISFNKKRGTIRGMHYQTAPYEEAKIVRYTKRKIFDVIIDLREESETFKKWHGFELSSENHKMLYIPEGFVHGFQTLENDTEIFYQMSQMHMPDYSRGIMYNDERFQISWPLPNPIISKKDLSW